MSKDYTIERAFRRYFDGAPAPKVDLTAAKEELSASVRRRSAIKRGLKWKIPALVAALLVLVLIGVQFLPALFVKHYSIAEAKASALELAEVEENYPGYLDGLHRFALADNAEAEYTLYSVDGKDVLLSADVRLLKGFVKFKASVFVDLSDRRYEADELKVYETLPLSGEDYSYRREFINGEYVYQAYVEWDERRYFIDYSAQDYTSFYRFMDLLF